MVVKVGDVDEASKTRKKMVQSYSGEAEGDEDKAIRNMQGVALNLETAKTLDKTNGGRLRDCIVYLWALGKAEGIDSVEVGEGQSGEEVEDPNVAKFYLPSQEERMKDDTPENKEAMAKRVAIGQSLTEEQRRQMVDTLWGSRKLLEPTPPGSALGALHRIPLIDNAIARSSYRWKTLQPSPEEQWLLDNVDKWVKEGLIEEIK